MGQGMQQRETHASPWRRAIIEISGKGNLSLQTDWKTKFKRHPRTISEARAKSLIVTKPAR